VEWFDRDANSYWLAKASWAISCPEVILGGLETVVRARLFRLWPYAAAIGIFAVSAPLFVAFEQRPDLWPWVVDIVQANWRRLLFGTAGQMLIFTIVLMVMEPFFLNWQKTTIFGVFVRRNISAVTDLGFMIAYMTRLKLVVQYAVSFGGAYVGSKLADFLPGSFRWELPSEGVLQVTWGFAVFFIITSFVAYWQHRLMHWRWFWQLHRFHHSATELNILTGFRDNPGEAIVAGLVALSPLIFLKVPSAGLFATFFLGYQIISSLQHSELPWSYGWIGRWIIVSPQNHQIHHSIDEEHRDRNFSTCPLWDHLFGTWYDGPNRPSAYGIPDRAHAERPLTQWMIDIWIFYRDITRSLAGAARAALARVTRRRSSSQDALDPTASIPAE
jgi:sterol desaturase/sphingolipid hydroxylase (fatty acid hydroxylase superfamily)